MKIFFWLKNKRSTRAAIFKVKDKFRDFIEEQIMTDIHAGRSLWVQDRIVAEERRIMAEKTSIKVK
jgi:hypothetical protein